MKKILLATMALACFSANAALIQTDWKTEGDGLAFVDEETGIEWLKLTETAGMSFNELSQEMDTTYAGWEFAGYHDTLDVLEKIFVTTDISSERDGVFFSKQYNFSSYNSDFDMFTHYFGANVAGVKGYTYGAMTNPFTGSMSLYGGNKGKVSQGYYYNYYLNYATFNDTDANERTGFYLTSNGGTTYSSINNPEINENNANSPYNAVSVSEPGSFAMLGLGALLVGFRRKLWRKSHCD